MLRKVYTGVPAEIKAASQGTVRAVFARLNVIDHDGDVTLPGAFQKGQKVRISAYNHASWGGMLPVGKGVIHEDGDVAILDGQFFLNTTAGRDTFEVVKGLDSLGGWSYGFDVLEASQGEFGGEQVQFLQKLDVHEVSPVLLGAGIDTQTLDVKGRGRRNPDAELARLQGAKDRLGPDVDDQFAAAELRRIEAGALLRDAHWERLRGILPKT